MIWLLAVITGSLIGFVASFRTLSSVVNQVAGWIVLGATTYACLRVFGWWMARYVITDQRVLLIEGVLSRRVSAIPLIKVTDTTFSRSILGRMFGYGDLLLDSPGEHEGLVRLTRLPKPDRLYRLIASLVVGRVWEGPKVNQEVFLRRQDEEDTGPLPRVH